MGYFFSCAKQIIFSTPFQQPIEPPRRLAASFLTSFPHFPQPLLLLDLFKAISRYKDLVIEMTGIFRPTKFDRFSTGCYDLPPIRYDQRPNPL